MKNITIKKDHLNLMTMYLLLTLLILMPFGTFLIQLSKLFFQSINVFVPDLLIKLIYGWKEVLLLLGLSLIFIKSVKEKKFPFEILKIDFVFLIFIFFGIFYGGYLTGFRVDRIVFGFRYDFAVFIFYFLARSVILEKNQFLNFFKIIIYISIPIILFGISQTFFLPIGFMENFGYSISESVTGNPLPPYHLINNTVRAMSTFPGPNSLAMYLVFVFFSILFLGRYFFKKYFKNIILLVVLFGLIITFSRGHIFGLLSSSIISLLTFIFFKTKINKEKQKNNFFKPLILTILLFLFFIMIFFGTFIVSDISKNQNSKIGSIIFRQTSTQAHSFMRELAFEPIKQKPLGHGIGTAGLATTNISDGKFNPESWPIQLVFEYGWLGLVFLFLIIFCVLDTLFKLYIHSEKRYNKLVVSFLFIFFLSMIISFNFLPSWFEVGSIMWWIFFGIFISNSGVKNLSNKDLKC